MDGRKSHFKLDQLLPDEFSSRILGYSKLNYFPALMTKYKMNIEPLIKNRLYREKIHRIKRMDLQL